MTDILQQNSSSSTPVKVSFRSWRSKPLLLVSGFVVLVIVVAVSCADFLAPHDPLLQDLRRILQGPSGDHLLGTDALGRDILSRLLHGGQPTLAGVAAAVISYAMVGMVLGILAGYLGGWIDRSISSVLDTMMSIPAIIMILAVLAIFSQNVMAAMLALGILSSAGLARIIRSACIALREELFVSAAIVSGLSSFRIMRRHILPGLVGQLIVQCSIFAGIALAVQTGLGFLGLATPAPAPSWGGMVGEASQVLAMNGSFLLVTGGTIGIMTVSLGLIGDGLRDANSDRSRSTTAVKLRAKKDTEGSGTASPEQKRTNVDVVLDVDDLRIGFATHKGITAEVVKGVSFTVGKGEIFGLVGESGSGKTMTALSLLGLLPSNGRITSGTAAVGNEDLATLSEKDFARKIRGREIGLVSQEPMVALDPMFTIGSQLREVITRTRQVPKAGIQKRALELLDSVKMPDPARIMKAYPHELSGGMLQRVVIAQALAGSPRLLIADEPTTALDVTVQAGILDLLRDLRDRLSMSIIIITHDLAVVADVCDRAIVMSAGTVVEEAEINDLFYRPRHEYTKNLLSGTPNVAGAL